MKYLFLCCAVLLTACCSGSLTNSGIFWCKKDAIHNQELLKEDLTKSQEGLVESVQQYEEREASLERLAAEKKSIKNTIRNLRKEIKQLQTNESNHNEQLIAAQIKLQEKEAELRKIQKIEAYMERPQAIGSEIDDYPLR